MTEPTTSGGPAGLADRVNQIRVPEPNADRERKLLLAGAVITVVGLVCVLVGYWGASGTAIAAEQIPYAISGGALGLGLIVVGCALVTRFSLARLFRYWLARIVHEHQVQTDREIEALGRIEAALTGAGAPARAAPGSDVDLGKQVDGTGEGRRVRREPLRAEPLDK